MSLTDDSDNTRAAIDAMPGPTVAVGHSYGGAVITSAAFGARNIVGLEMIHPDAERWMATRAGATTISIASSHASLRSHPGEIVDLIVRASAGATIAADGGRVAV